MRTSPIPVARRARSAAGTGLLALLLALCGVGLSACGSTTATAPLEHHAILSVDATTKTVHLLLAGSATNAYGGFNFDGYAAGEMHISIPIGWTVVVSCMNRSTVLTHSCAVIDDGAILPSGGPVAFPGAVTADPVNGLPCGGSATFRFVTSRLGLFRIACLVVGHEADGMWDWLRVTTGGLPSVTT